MVSFKKVLLTPSQLKIVAEIGVSVSQVTFASMVIPFLVPGFDRSKLFVVTLGVVVTLISWLLSILVVKKV